MRNECYHDPQHVNGAEVSLFGFLYLERPEAPGNVGLLDQLEALIWVKTHIENFGGDPDEVTLFGESAGAASVHMHVLSPLSQPYFKRFILQSGSATAPWALETKEAIFERAILVAQSLNCNVTKYDPYLNVTLVLECLLNASPENLLLQEWQAFEFLDFPWTPIVDGIFLIEEPRSSLQHGRFKKSQALIGNNLDEAIYFIVYFLPSVFKKDDLFSKNHFIHSDATFEECAYKLLPAYLKRNPIVKNAILYEYKDWSLPEDPMRRQDALDKMLGDYHFTCSVNEAAQAYLKHGGVVYSYYFTHRASAQTWPRWMGVVHGYEINFIFGEPFNPTFKYTTEEKELSKRFMRYWANFARTGRNPNSNPDGSWMSADVWPVYTQNQEYLTLSVNGSRIGHGPRLRQCAFWKQYIPRLLAATADLTDIELRWKQQFSKWEQEYIVDWKNEFDQFQRLNKYKYYDSDIRHCHNGHCDGGNGHL
uniref:Carboxylic ester hydrolase n=1 Tax=Romanomermis culicivorax TaxID=13658 RepID=A0A915K0B0_ROMCU